MGSKREKDNSLDFSVSRVSVASAINTNLQGPKSAQLLVQLLPCLYFIIISEELGVSREESSPQADCQRSWDLLLPFPRPGRKELMGTAEVRAVVQKAALMLCSPAYSLLLPVLIPSV